MTTTIKDLTCKADEHLRLLRYCQIGLAGKRPAPHGTMDLLIQLATEILPRWIDLALETCRERDDLDSEVSQLPTIEELEDELEDAERDLDRAHADLERANKRIHELQDRVTELSIRLVDQEEARGIR